MDLQQRLDADPDGHCLGVAYRVDGPEAAATLAYLRERELVSYAYDEVEVPVELEDGATVAALAYVSNRAHAQYRGGLDLEAIVRSVNKTGRAVVVHEAPRTCGFGAELVALVQERCFLRLEAPIARVTGFDTPFPYSLEMEYLPRAPRILKAVREVVAY